MSIEQSDLNKLQEAAEAAGKAHVRAMDEYVQAMMDGAGKRKLDRLYAAIEAAHDADVSAGDAYYAAYRAEAWGNR